MFPRNYISILVRCFFVQFFLLQLHAQAQFNNRQLYLLKIQLTNKDSLFDPASLKLTTQFASGAKCFSYVQSIVSILQAKGFAEASIDEAKYDSTEANITLHVGERYRWIHLQPDSIDEVALIAVDFKRTFAPNQIIQLDAVQQIQERLLNYYENQGYPFAAVYLDSIQLEEKGLSARLKLSRGPLYHIDSIRIIGKAKLSTKYLQRYLGIQNGRLYNKTLISQVDQRIAELPFIQAQQNSDLQLLGTGSVLNLYLQNRKNSQVDFLVGFLPANNQTNKLQLTGDIKLNLKNAFGKGESILLNWQQLQVQSPRLNIGYQQPYLWGSQFGIDFRFDLFKKDSSFLQINSLLGVQYLANAKQSGKLYLQQQSTFLLASGIDTSLIKRTRKLPAIADVKSVSVGIEYDLNQTDYKLNPRKGNEINFNGSVGIKNINKSADITALQDGTGFDFSTLYDSIQLKSYQVKMRLGAAHYFSSGKRSTIKVGLQAGWFSSEQIFRNELFQIGGYKLLRGFDEESIYANKFAVTTAELRYLTGIRSYLFTFVDAGWVKTQFQGLSLNQQFLSGGLGIVLETKSGLLNLSYAIGKRDDVNFDLKRASKIHFGYVNYF
ncbi:MAG: hypothetical protein RLY16_2637 [Bacteroidota bacterium]